MVRPDVLIALIIFSSPVVIWLVFLSREARGGRIPECWNCGYWLIGKRHVTCPECGKDQHPLPWRFVDMKTRHFLQFGWILALCSVCLQFCMIFLHSLELLRIIDCFSWSIGYPTILILLSQTIGIVATARIRMRGSLHSVGPVVLLLVNIVAAISVCTIWAVHFAD